MTAPGKAPTPPRGGGKAPRRAAPKRIVSAAQPTQAKHVEFEHQKQDMLTWEKKSSGGWVSGQSMGINPGDPRAITRLRHSKKFKARGKKVIRPRTKKLIHTD